MGFNNRQLPQAVAEPIALLLLLDLCMGSCASKEELKRSPSMKKKSESAHLQIFSPHPSFLHQSCTFLRDFLLIFLA